MLCAGAATDVSGVGGGRGEIAGGIGVVAGAACGVTGALGTDMDTGAGATAGDDAGAGAEIGTTDAGGFCQPEAPSPAGDGIDGSGPSL
jgi:hypothetical protein